MRRTTAEERPTLEGPLTTMTITPPLLRLLLLLLIAIHPPSTTALDPIIATTNNNNNNDNEPNCPLPRPHLSLHPLRPTWQASYPGSGSRMTWSLLQSLTSLQTGDDFNTHHYGYANVLTVKTHYPVKTAREGWEGIDVDVGFERAIVLLRNPMHAIPSYFNLLFERRHRLPNHSRRGGVEEWVRYRDHLGHGVMEQLELVERFVRYWMERFRGDARGNMLLVSFEELVDDVRGPEVARRMVEFLARGNEGLVDVDPGRVPCVWRAVVKYKDVNQESLEMSGRRDATVANPHSLREGPNERPYRADQLEGMSVMLHRLMEAYSYDEEFVGILRGYVEVVSKTMPAE
ncbi:hypothetical protein HJC23_002088 [Cyclotella cryptica]|uniref:Sulfotransferase domain-containing protein n=1 Tax=Cyclotella cryptica TaxID=29204 RepID=A0ABD3P7H6_9STRA|eukprot:CCRYP_017104-RA/>CCRYP_017104-RA protein AED:0.00 eAED:0.00 QI:75/-1/1/1/-1/1/1/717/345